MERAQQTPVIDLSKNDVIDLSEDVVEEYEYRRGCSPAWQDMRQIEGEIRKIEEKISACTVIQDSIFLEATIIGSDSMVKWHCPLLPRDCQLEIIKMLIPSPLPPSLFPKRSRATSRDRASPKGFRVKVLPKARKVSQPPVRMFRWPSEDKLYKLRQSFDLTFDIPHMDLNVHKKGLIISYVLLDRKIIMKSTSICQLSDQMKLLNNTTAKLSTSLSNMETSSSFYIF